MCSQSKGIDSADISRFSSTLQSYCSADGCNSFASGPRLALRLFVYSEFGARRIRENGKCAGTWGDVCSWRPPLATRTLDLCESVRNIIHHNVYACLFVWSSVALLHPCSANAACVVERKLTVATLSHGPPKNAAIEAG